MRCDEVAKKKFKQEFQRRVASALGSREQRNESDLPVPICPRCGFEAEETMTQYGIRAACCGLWSWNRKPLADEATHSLRKKLHKEYVDLSKSLGTGAFFEEIRKRSGINDPESLLIRNMNEATAAKVKVAVEEIMIDVLMGNVEQKKGA